MKRLITHCLLPLLADRSATLLASSCRLSLCPSVCKAVQFGRCTALKVVPACSRQFAVTPFKRFC